MRATVLVDNISRDELAREWGLSIFIEYGEQKILLDTGASGIFRQNAEKLGIDLEKVDFGVLSHAHFDHAYGLDTFFTVNKRASFYLREGSEENCFSQHLLFKKYIGLRKGTLKKYADRIQFSSGDDEISEGVYLIPHKLPGMEKVGEKAKMYRKIKGRYCPDDFSHEQSLVLRTQKGLVVFNSCSHAGADNIIREVSDTFPDEKLYALIGGFHLFQTPEWEVRQLAQRMKKTGIKSVYTGHCTGKRAYQLLEEEMPGCVKQLYTGLVIEF